MSNERIRSITHSDADNESLPRHNQSTISASQKSSLDSDDRLATQNPIVPSHSYAIREDAVAHLTETSPNTCNNLSHNVRKWKSHDGREGKMTLARSQKRNKITANLSTTIPN